MEPYPPTLDVRFSKDHLLELVRDKYQLNAYLLGTIFSVTKEAGHEELDDNLSEDSSDSKFSLFNSSESEEKVEGDESPISSTSRQQRERGEFMLPFPRFEDTKDRKY